MSTPGKGLSRRQFDQVIRRAAELTAQDSESGAELVEDDVIRIAGEVGLPEHHVRRALSEVRAGAVSTGVLDRFYGPEHIICTRVVPGSLEEVGEKVDNFLVGGQLLQRVRRTQRFLQYRPSVDWISSMARAASSSSSRYYVASAKSVEVRLDEAEPGYSIVEFVVDPGIRSEWVAGGMVGGISGGGVAGVASAVSLATVIPDPVALVVGLAAATGIFAGVHKLTARGHRRKWQEILAEVEGILDALQAGETLEPPPPAWRRWVEKQFHGARRLFEQNLDG